MLTAEKNKMLTQVGPGTPMGDYLRRYWQPIGGASELDDNPIKAIRLLGEDLVLYKDLGGRYGLRRPALSASARRPVLRLRRGDRHPLQLSRLADGRGRPRASSSPTTTPSTRSARAKERCTTTAYPVKECAGLLFAYMGPQPVPELPVWEPFTWENGFREVVISDIPCNWFQCQENSCDPVHFEWMHENWSARLNGQERRPMRPSTSSSCSRSSTTASSTSACARTSDEGDPVWTVGRVTLWPNGFYLGNHFEWRVPIDDENTLQRLLVLHARAEGPRALRAGQGADLGAARSRTTNGRWISSHVINQDIIAWVGQGTIADRTKETLGASDLGIAMMRKRFFDELDAVARGAEPKGVVRNSERRAGASSCRTSPRRPAPKGITLAEHENYPLLKVRLKGFRHCYGQPPEVRRAFEEAMGIAGSEE